MLKKSISFCAFLAALVLSASPIAKIPVTAAVSGYANVGEIIKYPMINQALAANPLPAGLTVDDFNGKVALGITIGKPASKENMRVDIVYTTAKPVAAKFFALFAEKAIAQGAKKTKIGGKPAVADKNSRVILVSSKEIIMQVRKGKVNFANLKKGKNLLTAAPEIKKNSAVMAFNIAACLNMVPTVPAEAKGKITQEVGILSAKLAADGSVALTFRVVHKNAEDCNNSLADFNQKVEQLKQNPMAAIFAEKFTAAVKGNDLVISGKFSAEEVKAILAQAMMFVGTMSQQLAAPGAAPAAPATPAPAAK